MVCHQCCEPKVHIYLAQQQSLSFLKSLLFWQLSSSTSLKALKNVTLCALNRSAFRRSEKDHISCVISGSLAGDFSREKRWHPAPTDFLWHVFLGQPQFLPVLSGNDCSVFSLPIAADSPHHLNTHNDFLLTTCV